MTEPSAPRPVPGPPHSAAGHGPRSASPAPAAPAPDSAGSGGDHSADLDDRPVSEHVAVFEAEHARLERELGTIDRL